jgi:hypothetical protein
MCYTVWSAFLSTWWYEKQELCCMTCDLESQLGAGRFCLSLGRWGFPFGRIMMPVQIFRNVRAIVVGPDPLRPSAALIDGVRRTTVGRSGPGSSPKRMARGMTSYSPMGSAPPKRAPVLKIDHGPGAADRNTHS